MKVDEIKHGFSRAAKTYSENAKVQKEIGERLFRRLDYFKLKPRRILDIGAGPGSFTSALKKRFPKASIVACDLSHVMLSQIKTGWRFGPLRVVADMVHMPFADNSFDLIFANQVLHWAPLKECLKEIARVLRPEGLYLFSTLGPDTFKELKDAWAQIDSYQHVNVFHDMHDVGDALMQSRFVDPVIDREALTLRYKEVKEICRDLKAQGVRNVHSNRNKGLMTLKKWKKFEQSYARFCDKEGWLPLGYEVIYGQAFGAKPVQECKEVVVPLSALKGRRL